MRALLGISIAAVVAVTVWWSLPTHATQQYSDVSIDALGMMVTTTNLPRDPVYDQGTVFSVTRSASAIHSVDREIVRVIGLLAPSPSPPKALVASPSLATRALFLVTDATGADDIVGTGSSEPTGWLRMVSAEVDVLANRKTLALAAQLASDRRLYSASTISLP